MTKAFGMRGFFELFVGGPLGNGQRIRRIGNEWLKGGVVVCERRLLAHPHRQPAARTGVDTIRRTALRAHPLVSFMTPASFCPCLRTARPGGALSYPGVLS